METLVIKYLQMKSGRERLWPKAKSTIFDFGRKRSWHKTVMFIIILARCLATINYFWPEPSTANEREKSEIYKPKLYFSVYYITLRAPKGRVRLGTK